MPEHLGGPEHLPIPCKHYIMCFSAAFALLRDPFHHPKTLDNHIHSLLNSAVSSRMTSLHSQDSSEAICLLQSINQSINQLIKNAQHPFNNTIDNSRQS